MPRAAPGSGRPRPKRDIVRYVVHDTRRLELAAAVSLRRSHGTLPRPYRVPLGTRGLALFVVPPIATNAYMMYIAAPPLRHQPHGAAPCRQPLSRASP